MKRVRLQFFSGTHCINISLIGADLSDIDVMKKINVCRGHGEEDW